MTLLAIDPGIDVGWALFTSERRLKACGLGTPTECQPDEILIECPRLRPVGEKNPNAILTLARTAGEWGGRYWDKGLVRYLTPNDWKKSTPKDISHRRIWYKLDPQEIKALVIGCTGVSPRSAPIDEAIRKGLTTSDKRHNIMDALGLGLHGVGR